MCLVVLIDNVHNAVIHELAVLQATTRKTRILDVVYNASNNELVSACIFLCSA